MNYSIRYNALMMPKFVEMLLENRKMAFNTELFLPNYIGPYEGRRKLGKLCSQKSFMKPVQIASMYILYDTRERLCLN